eukprot:4317534-Amphidinium_carterae.1
MLSWFLRTCASRALGRRSSGQEVGRIYRSCMSGTHGTHPPRVRAQQGPSQPVRLSASSFALLAR